MNIITMPWSLVVAQEFNWDIDWRGQGAQETNAGSRQIVYNQFPRWYGKPKLTLEGENIRLWRAIRAEAQGRFNVYRIPMIDPMTFDFNSIPLSEQNIGVENAEGVLFSTGYGYEYQPFILALANASVGATTLDVDTSGFSAFVPKAGHIYSHNDFPFIVTSVTELATNQYRLTVRMAVRSAITAGDVIRLIPYGLFVAEDDLTGRVTFDGARYAQPEFAFVEYQR